MADQSPYFRYSEAEMVLVFLKQTDFAGDQAWFLHSSNIPWSSLSCPCLDYSGSTEDHLEHRWIGEHALHHRIAVHHAFHHGVLLHHLPQSIGIFHHLLNHSLVLRVVQHLLHFVGIDCAGNCAHVLRVIHHLITAHSEGRRTSEPGSHSCSGNGLLFGGEDLCGFVSYFLLLFFGSIDNHHDSGFLKLTSLCGSLPVQNFSLGDQFDIGRVRIEEVSEVCHVLFDGLGALVRQFDRVLVALRPLEFDHWGLFTLHYKKLQFPMSSYDLISPFIRLPFCEQMCMQINEDLILLY